MRIKEYNLRWFKLCYSSVWSGVLMFVIVKLFSKALDIFSAAETEEFKMLSIILIGMMAFAMRLRFPRFSEFYTLPRSYEDE